MNVLTLPRLVIEQITPSVDGGKHPIKRLVGDRIPVTAVIYKDGHEVITARILSRPLGQAAFNANPLEYEFDPDCWYGSFEVAQIGNWEMLVEAWPDPFRTWRRDLEKRIEAGQDVRPELLEGASLIRKRAVIAEEKDREPLLNAARVLADEKTGEETRRRVAFSKTLFDLMYGPLDLGDVSRSDVFPVRVDRREAGFAAWYELFPRSQGQEPGRHGTFKDTERRIPEIATMGFDVLYLPPIHPIGETHRKGRNNARTCEAGDVGSPWAIGGAAGGHTAIHPELGTVEDFKSLVRTAADFGIEIALDFALQCSPDHPWVKEHPEWFFVRPDGSIRYAENPPKKYEDIYPLNFWGTNSDGLWKAARDALLYWAELGVRTFRVDNPHTKPLSFWEWCIAEVQKAYPDTVFLSESFTRPNRMQGLAKLGFSQSYTYFTWKNTKQELIDYMAELTHPPMSECYRPNFFANTPDILHEYLVHGGRPAFRIRALLAATLAPVYGIYSGYELCENVPVKPGSEEYLDSEKYEIRVRDWNAPGNIKRDIARLNTIRRGQPALSELTNLEFIKTENEEVLGYVKTSPKDPSGNLLCIVTLNPREVRESNVYVPLAKFGIAEDEDYIVHDLLTGTNYTWRGSKNYVRFEPDERVGHLFLLRRGA